MVTRKDVARRAYVSTATVSNVINNKPGVSEELRKRVWDAIEELGYKPNLVARSLKTSQTKQIALVTNGISNPYFAAIALGMEEEAFQKGYIVCVLNARSDREYVDELLKRQFDGIVMSNDKIPVSQVNRLTRYGVPVVFIGNEGYSGFDDEVILVNIDLYSGAVKVFEYLISKGHTRIGFMAARSLQNEDEPDYRLKAYKNVLSKYNIPYDPSLVHIYGDTPDYAYSSSMDMFSSFERPTAVFTGNDYLASSVYCAARRSGLNIPDDVSIVGFNNLYLGQYLVPALTTVDVPNFELGKKVMELLLAKMNGDSVTNVNMATKIVIRESVKNLKK